MISDCQTQYLNSYGTGCPFPAFLPAVLLPGNALFKSWLGVSFVTHAMSGVSNPRAVQRC